MVFNQNEHGDLAMQEIVPGPRRPPSSLKRWYPGIASLYPKAKPVIVDEKGRRIDVQQQAQLYEMESQSPQPAGETGGGMPLTHEQTVTSRPVKPQREKFAPTSEMGRNIEGLMKQLTGAIFTQSPRPHIPTEWSTSPQGADIIDYVANLAWDRFIGNIEKDGQVITEEITNMIGDVVAKFVRDERYRQVPERHAHKLVKPDLPAEDTLESGREEALLQQQREETEIGKGEKMPIHGLLMQQVLDANENHAMWQMARKVPAAEKGMTTAMLKNFGGARKYDYFAMFPEDMPPDVKAHVEKAGWSASLLKENVSKFGNQVDRLVPNGHLRVELDKALTNIIEANKDHKPFDLSNLDDEEAQKYLTNIEKYLFRKASGYGSALLEGDLGTANLGQTSEGETVDVPEKARGDWLRQQDIEAGEVIPGEAKHQLMSLTKPTIAGVSELINELSNAWRTNTINKIEAQKGNLSISHARGNQKQIDKINKSLEKLRSRLNHADMLQLFAESAGSVFDSITRNSEAQLKKELGVDVVQLAGEGVAVKFNPQKDNRGNIVGYTSPDLSSLVSKPKMMDMVGRLINDKKIILTYANSFNSNASPEEQDTQLQGIISGIQSSFKLTYDKDFVKRTLIQGQGSIAALEAKGIDPKNRPIDTFGQDINTSIGSLSNIVRQNKDKYNGDVVKAFFSLIGIRQQWTQPFKLNEENGQLTWIYPSSGLDRGGNKKFKHAIRNANLKVDDDTEGYTYEDNNITLPVRMPVIAHYSSVANMPAYYELTQTPVPTRLKDLLEFSGLADTGPDKDKDVITRDQNNQPFVDENGQRYVVGRYMPIMTIDDENIVTPLRSRLTKKQYMLLRQLCKYAFDNLNILNSAKRAIFKQSSVSRIFEAIPVLERKEREIYAYLSNLLK